MVQEQTFRSPGFFEREIDLTQRQQAPVGTPAGVIGTAERGPAFVPVTVGSFADFKSKFGGLNFRRFGPYAVNEFLKHKTAVTYLRVLGAGANDTTTDIENTRTQGTVKNAGFKVQGTVADGIGRHAGAVQFIAARHDIRSGETFGFPMFSDNDSFDTSGNKANLVRAMVLLGSGTRMLVMDGDSNTTAVIADAQASASLDATTISDEATPGSVGAMFGKFKLIISSSADGFATTDGYTGLRILTASLNPTDTDYISKILNTDPDRFSEEEHLLYADFRVEDELATIDQNSGSVMVLSGTAGTSSTSGDSTVAFRDLFGRFDTRFQTPRSTAFISQPYGTKEFDLFHFESLSDGAWANSKFKISVSNVRKSTNPANEYGTFSIQIRGFSDTDFAPQVLEQFSQCTLDPTSENYVARVVGDLKAYYEFDADSEDERRIIVKGKYPNRSQFVRIVMNDAVERKLTPATALPFGFRGMPSLKTTDSLTDNGSALGTVGVVGGGRLIGSASIGSNVTGSIIPPVPFTFKVTRGVVSTTPGFVGAPGTNEIVDSRIHWGVKTTRVAPTGSLTNAALNPNASSVTNPLISNLTKFLGIAKLDALVTGSAADSFQNNKFTLAKVALGNVAVTQLTGSAAQHMRDAAYIRNGSPNPNDYSIDEPLLSNRITLATLVNLTSSAEFNRFSNFTKFTNVLHGGFDGFNILDPDSSRMNDKASSSDTGGGANSSYLSPALSSNMNGVGKDANGVFSYKTAARIMTDELTVNTNVLAIPGIRDSFITDFAGDRCRDNGLILFIKDLVMYDENVNRLYDDSTTKPDVEKTSEQFESRAVDNSYGSTYFPGVIIDDADNNRRVKVPASVAALGALAFNDKVGFPWFAPAGFNRGGLDFVSNVETRLNSSDRDRLYDARINPIATFPRQGTAPTFVIFGQKTLQQASSALDRVNVRRLLLEIKRIITNITKNFVFEQNTPATRSRWVSSVTPRLAIVQAQSGIEGFRVVMDESNNTQDDIENNKLNGRIEIVPTRTVESIAIDFIVTNAGVEFAE